MTIYGFFELLRARRGLLAGAVAASLLAGGLLFLTRPELYEAYILIEAVQPSAPRDAAALTRHAIESGSLGRKIAARTGGGAFRLKAAAGFYNRFIKIYVFVPAGKIEAAKTALGAVPAALMEEFAAEKLSARVVMPPSASDLPAGSSLGETLSAFFMLGLFAGLSAALRLEDRKNAAKERP